MSERINHHIVGSSTSRSDCNIKVEKAPEFDNFLADKLKLWKVEIPDCHDVQLSNLSFQVQDQLLATKKISKYFPDKLILLLY
ncbi:hypothetical protein GLOIN_2v1883277 [Rhizophagus clarus]|uniref:Crinkler effector protein N-terminal domain-containing protein n=1 Tax=Rhizophagus clarus TaxID=94130 RepID=A0A8H3MFT0_9GLOM|nr:hypothetical protein GLOIN_2v1883277 [Rhizophagus clarus]